ncbi:hypothetical protein F5877DRAFT_73213 [Lentinula edodes]|nr:hypothetical protein F5877DRAFT_73213 [Lentinula edodes]
MSPAPTRLTSRTPSPLLPTLTTLGEVPSPGPESDGEVEANQLAFTIESPSGPQLQLFETDDPLWLLLAEVASSCTNCSKTTNKCKVLLNSPRCTNCSAKKTCSLGKILRYRYFAHWCNQDLAYSRRFLELHGTPAHQSTWGIPLSVWHEYDAALHARTSSTSTLLELNMLDERDTIDADQQELQRFLALQQNETVVAAKRTESDSLFPNMPPTPCSTLVPRALTAHPYRAENQRLLDQRENSSLTTALRDTSHALEARQWEVEQLRTSRQEVLQHEVKYRTVLDQFRTLDRSLSGLPGQTVLQRFQALVEELRVAKRDRDAAVRKLSPASRKSSELMAALLQQQGLVDETNALASRQRRRLEELQEEVHCTRNHAVFVEQMIKEYPDEGFYEVVLPPLSQLEGDLKKAHKDIRPVTTFAHRLYHSDPAMVLYHHSRYIGAIIEAVIAFLQRGLDSADPDVVAHNFQLTLDYMQTARGIHGDLYMQSISSIRWFFNNAVDKDEGLVLGAGWSLKGATRTATEDGNDLVVAGMTGW